MLSSIATTGLALAIAFSGSTTDGPPTSDATFTVQGNVTKEVTLTRWGFAYGAWYTPPHEQCPAEAPYLTHDHYPGPSSLTPYNIPRGIEVRALDPWNIGVTIWPATVTEVIDGQSWVRNTGIGVLSSITNYKGPGGGDTNWVEIVLHCTN